jgi:chromosome segregation protein
VIFKKLEMQGFKSFFDRTTVNFQDGINAVVGPNGCGKSNIADAIRWVLGEQSPKRLRGETMEDLIFAGSDARRALGMAEVALTVEANGREFPVPYSAFAEICVTRRLYRSGESEFLINNTSCRLRDIRELFMDTGLNPRAYAVIDQGHIGDVISSKPEDRRILFEEAAGIARYKERKTTALRKLDATEQNLLRLHDIVREIKRQIRSLKLQATKARKYHDLTSEIEELELKMLYRQHSGYQEKHLHQEKKIRTLDEIRGTLQVDSEAAETSLEADKLSLLGLEKEVSEAREEFYSHRAQTESKGHLLEASRTRSGEIADTMKRGKIEESRLVLLLEELAAERTRIGEELKALDAGTEATESSRRETDERLGGIVGRAETARRDLEEKNSRFLEEVRAEGETQNRVTQAETMRDSLTREMERLDREIAELERQESVLHLQEEGLLSSLEKEKEGQRELREGLSRCSQSLAAAKSTLEETEQSLNRTREEHTQATSRLASLTELETSLSGWPERFRKELDRIFGNHRLNGHVKGLLAGSVTAPAEYETALEAVLGEKLKCLLVSSHQTAIEAARALREESEVRGTLIPLEPRSAKEGGPVEGEGVVGRLADFVSTPPEHRQVVDHLLRDVVLVEDLEKASRLWSANGSSRTFVTPGGEVLWADGSLTAGTLDPSRELLPLLRRVRETKAAAADSGARVRDMEAERERLRTTVASLSGEEDDLSASCTQAELSLANIEKDLSHLRQKQTSREEKLVQLRGSRATTADERSTLESKIVEEITRRSELEGGRVQRQQEIASLEEELVRLRGEEEELGRKISAARIEVASGRERSSHLRSRLERIAVEWSQAESRRDEVGEEVVGLRAERVREEERATELAGRLEDLKDSQEEREKKLTTLQERQRLASGRIRETEENLRLTRRKSEELQQERGEIHARQAELQVRLENVRDRVGEIRGCSPGELWDEEARSLVLREELSVLEEAHGEKAARLQSLGPVNLAAIGDHQELQERLDFQVKQQEDLEKASEDLRRAIQKINATSRKKFIDTFEMINEKFQRVFPLLFTKGQATLKLTDADDPLEAGIEVMAQPAGKNLQRLSLLSGGEKALSAIALLLSIFMVKPTPFCLLDEVDAPLDDSNTVRFLDLLRDSINGSQLVVITHNKQTMEKAVNLVGVTMADPGVSSLISVKLSDN